MKSNEKNIIDTLKTIFNEQTIVDKNNIYIEKGKNNKSIVLIEQANDDKPKSLQKIKILGFDNIYFVINFDKLPFLHGRTDTSCSEKDSLLIAENIRKSCDYIVWANIEGQDVLLLIELKSTHNKDTISKFKSSKSFVIYFNALINEFYPDISNISDFHIIPILINQAKGRKTTPTTIENFTFFHVPMGTDTTYPIFKDSELLLTNKK